MTLTPPDAFAHTLSRGIPTVFALSLLVDLLDSYSPSIQPLVRHNILRPPVSIVEVLPVAPRVYHFPSPILIMLLASRSTRSSEQKLSDDSGYHSAGKVGTRKLK